MKQIFHERSTNHPSLIQFNTYILLTKPFTSLARTRLNDFICYPQQRLNTTLNLIWQKVLTAIFQKEKGRKLRTEKVNSPSTANNRHINSVLSNSVLRAAQLVRKISARASVAFPIPWSQPARSLYRFCLPVACALVARHDAMQHFLCRSKRGRWFSCFS